MIRKIKESDYNQIAEIYNHYILNTIVSFEEEAITATEVQYRVEQTPVNCEWLVYESEDRICGYAYSGLWNKRIGYRYSAEVSIYLAPDWGGKGIGTLLYTELINNLKSRDFKNVIGGIALPNPASIALHQKFGFVKAAHYKNIGIKFNTWIDVVYYQLTL